MAQAKCGALQERRSIFKHLSYVPRLLEPLLHFSRSGSSRKLRSQVYTGSVGAENFPYFVAHPAKNSENLFFTSRSFGGIVKAPVVSFHHPGKYRTRLVGVSTDRDHRVHFLIQEFLEVLRTVTRNVDPNLFHGADR